MSFFSFEETVGKPQARTIRACGGCGLYKTCKNPRQGVRGKDKEGILIVGRSPNENDELLADLLQEHEINFKDCWKVHAVSCEPPRGKAVSDKHIEYCRPTVTNAIKELEPDIIILCGDEALKSVIGPDINKSVGSIQKWRGVTIPHRTHKAWVCPVYHPNYIDEAAKKYRGVSELILRQDIERIVNLPNLELPEFTIEVLTDEVEILKHLTLIQKKKPTFAYDYETTGLKPHASGHAIACVGISYKRYHAISFMLPKKGRVLDVFRSILADETIKKYAQNMKMEDRWSYHILGVETLGWVWDSMLASHCLDNRTGITGLKHQAYVRYGIVGYDDMISSYLKSKDGSNGFNNVFNAPQHDLCYYCGFDAGLTYCLSEDQQKEIVCLQQ